MAQNPEQLQALADEEATLRFPFVYSGRCIADRTKC